jgi:hypothetical protein
MVSNGDFLQQNPISASTRLPHAVCLFRDPTSFTKISDDVDETDGFGCVIRPRPVPCSPTYTKYSVLTLI